MMMNMFNNFDPYNLNFIPMIYLFSMNLIILKLNFMWMNSFKNLFIMKFSLMNMISNKSIKSNKLLLNSMFIFIFLMNFMNLIPYYFSISNNLMLTLSMTMMYWMTNLIYLFMNNLNILFLNFCPKNTPMYLILIINLIEFNSFLFQIFSLSLRLMINMMMGHIIINLINNFNFIFIYLIFELFIICIQSYVFFILNLLNLINSNYEN